MVRVDSAPNGNCFFESVAYALEHSVISNGSTSNHFIQHLNGMGLINGSDKIDVCTNLRKLVVEEWLSHSDSYKPFLTGTHTFEVEAKAFLKNGHFAADLGNSVPLAMANVLCLLMVVLTQMENLPVLPTTPRDCMQCMQIFIAIDQSGAGHHDAVTQITLSEPSCEVGKSVEVQSKSECCRCGQGAKKREGHCVL